MRRFGWLTSVILILLFVLLPVAGDVLPQNSPETQEISVSTNILAEGSLSQGVELQWQISSEVLGANLVFRGDEPEPVLEPEPPLHPGGEVQSAVSYSENTQATLGFIEYRRTGSVETSERSAVLMNVENDRLITFVGSDAGRLYSSEDIAMDNVGNYTSLFGMSTLCPFLGATTDCLPGFCNRFEAGSEIDMSRVSVSTSAGVRNINGLGDPGLWRPVPEVGNPALGEYSIRVTGIGNQASSIGMASAYSEIIINEGRLELPACPILHQTIKFQEDRSVIGEITTFEYLVSYESGPIR